MALASYEALEARVEADALRLVSIIAPPRSSSTALERLLLESPDADGQFNEPWSLLDSPERERHAYDVLLERVEALEAKTPRRPLTVVVKNIADYIPPGECFERWMALARLQLFLVRNPLLCIESLVNMVVQDVEKKRHVLKPLDID